MNNLRLYSAHNTREKNKPQKIFGKDLRHYLSIKANISDGLSSHFVRFDIKLCISLLCLSVLPFVPRFLNKSLQIEITLYLSKILVTDAVFILLRKGELNMK